jgi:hypothetical protein
MPEPEHTGLYRLDELGWAQFELVCHELLAAEGIEALSWAGRADELRTAVTDSLPRSFGLRGPVLVAIAWVRRRPGQAFGDNEIGYRLSRTSSAFGFTSVLVLTNDASVTPDGILRRSPISLDLDPGGLHVVGPEWIESLLARYPAVPRLVPSLLGVRDLDGTAGQECAARSSWDLDAGRELARVFVPTRAYRGALEVLERHHFAVLSGPPEMGKTAIARILGLALQVEGWEVHECIRPEQIWRAFDRSREQLFIADDAFGSTEYRPDAAERWSLDLPRILQAVDARHKLVWTSRPAPLKAGLARINREHGVERFPRPAEVNIDAATLDVEEKATMLLRHAKAEGLESRAAAIVWMHSGAIVRHAHFTPERIRRFVATRLRELAQEPRSSLVLPAIAREIAEPTRAMADSFAALEPEHRALLVALVDSPPGPVSTQDLASATRRHAPSGLPCPVNQLVDRLSDHFVRVVPPDSVTWVHPSWRDLVIEETIHDAGARARFLESCSLEGALLALSRGGGETGERRRPFLVTDGDWDRLSQRLYELAFDLADPDVGRLLTALEDGLTSAQASEAAEMTALAETVLRAVAAAWSSGRSFASPAMLVQFNGVWSLLGQPELDVKVKLWLPQRGERYEPAVQRHHAGPVPRVNWGDDDAESAIVLRILSDLDAA